MVEWEVCIEELMEGPSDASANVETVSRKFADEGYKVFRFLEI